MTFIRMALQPFILYIHVFWNVAALSWRMCPSIVLWLLIRIYCLYFNGNGLHIYGNGFSAF